MRTGSTSHTARKAGIRTNLPQPNEPFRGDKVDIGVELRNVYAAAQSSLPLDRHIEFFQNIAEDCFVPPRCVAAVAVIVNEALSNAIDYAHPSGVAGKISFDCRRDGGSILIDVSDDGVGLPDGFDPTADGGRGLRLMRQLNEQLGGTLAFESGCLGLRVRLRLPRTARDIRVAAATEPNGRADVEQVRSCEMNAERLMQKLMNRRQLNGALSPVGHWDQIFQALAGAIYTTDAAGRITFYNEAAAELWGCRPELGKSEFCGSWKLYRPDGTPMPHDECPMALTLREKRPVRGIEAVAERPDGKRILFIPYPSPLFDDSGELVGAINLLVDVSHQRQVTEQLASIVDASDDAIISKDVNGIISTWNRAAERLFGYKAEEVIGKPITILIPAERSDEEPKILGRILRGEQIKHYETVRRHKDGGLIDISLTVSPVKDAVGRIIGASKIARDVTERKRSEKQRDLLLDEIKHRVKNTVATVQAVARQTIRSASKSDLESFSARMHALGNAYDLLTSDTWDRAPLRDIVDRALGPFQSTRFIVEGPDVWLNATKSLQLTMVLHELATNAIKYGALSNADGQVRLTWEMQIARLKITWHETDGPPVTPPERKGFGSTLIKQTFAGAVLDFAPLGVVCTFEIAL